MVKARAGARTGVRLLLVAVILISALGGSRICQAEMMSVRQLKELFESGPQGELAAVSYVNGTIDGMLAIDSLHQKERKLPPEFCAFDQAKRTGKSIKHPAYRTREFLVAWEREGKPMDAIAVDFVLAILDSQYGCPQKKR